MEIWRDMHRKVELRNGDMHRYLVFMRKQGVPWPSALELRTVPSLQNRNELCTGNGEMS